MSDAVMLRCERLFGERRSDDIYTCIDMVQMHQRPYSIC